MKNLKYIFVGVGASIGAFIRYILEVIFDKIHILPIGTLVANTLACFLVGFIVNYILNKYKQDMLKPFLITGVCGGLSTFSSLSIQNVHFLMNGNAIISLIYLIISIILGTSAILIGSLIKY